MPLKMVRGVIFRFRVANDNIVCGNEKSVGDLALCRKTLAAAGCAEYQAVKMCIRDRYYEILELSSFRYKSDILSNIF